MKKNAIIGIIALIICAIGYFAYMQFEKNSQAETVIIKKTYQYIPITGIVFSADNEYTSTTVLIDIAIETEVNHIEQIELLDPLIRSKVIDIALDNKEIMFMSAPELKHRLKTLLNNDLRSMLVEKYDEEIIRDVIITKFFID